MRQTSLKEDYALQNQSEFLEYYHSDPFFKAKLDYKLIDIEKWFKTKNKKLTRPKDLGGLKPDVFKLKLDVSSDLA